MATERSPSLCNIRSNRGAGGSLPGLSPQFPDLKIAAAIRGEVDDVTGEESARRDTPLRTPPGRRTLLTIQWAEIFGSPCLLPTEKPSQRLLRKFFDFFGFSVVFGFSETVGVRSSEGPQLWP